jgi:putative endonuclease
MRPSDAWCVYILSNKAHTTYIGSTNDLLRRVREHREKKHADAFTARYTFDRLVYYEFVADEASARLRVLRFAQDSPLPPIPRTPRPPF